MNRSFSVVMACGVVLRAAVGLADPAAEKPAVSLFDGKTLAGWKITDFAGHGDARVEDGTIVLEQGDAMTGITLTPEKFTASMPKIDYELTLEAMRVDGNDFFCGLTFPVGDDPCTMIVGGWGGSVVGLSSLNGEDASQNETTTFQSFNKGKWYAIRLRVAKDRIQAWIDDEKVVDVATADHKFSVRVEVEASRPLGFASWYTTAALKDIKVRKL
ncbi:MAG TPA: DUF1080 domain-containing protein [Pirellulales bacterium]|nr:DUF1080 domain-containing protein [Pirellulales bacterium]